MDSPGQEGRAACRACARMPSACLLTGGALAGAGTREVEAEMAPRGRASGRRAEVGVRAEVAGWSRGLGGDRDRQVRRRRRRRRLGRRVEASGARSVRWWLPATRQRVPGQRECPPLPTPLPVPFSPHLPHPAPLVRGSGAAPSVLPSIAHPHRPCFSFPCPGQPPP